MRDPSVYDGKQQGDLLGLNLPNLEAKILKVISNFKCVAGTVLFGSALDLVRPESDIDVGIVLQPGHDELAVAADVEYALGRFGCHPFQVTVLADTAPVAEFTYRAFNSGKVIHMADEDFTTDIIEKVSRIHEENRQFMRIYDAARGRSSYGVN